MSEMELASVIHYRKRPSVKPEQETLCGVSVQRACTLSGPHGSSSYATQLCPACVRAHPESWEYAWTRAILEKGEKLMDVEVESVVSAPRPRLQVVFWKGTEHEQRMLLPVSHEIWGTVLARGSDGTGRPVMLELVLPSVRR